MRLKLISNPSSGDYKTQVVNAETGEPIPGIMSAHWSQESASDVPILKLELVNVDVEAEIKANGGVVMVKPIVDPPFLIKANRTISMVMMRNFQRNLEDAISRGQIPVFDETVDLFQKVDGRWVHITPEPAPASGMPTAPDTGSSLPISAD